MIHLGHGANVAEIATIYGKRQEDIIDFSANISPFISEHLKEVLEDALMHCKNYPDIHYTQLRRELGEYLGCHMAQIIPGNGATEIIYLLMRVLGEIRGEKTFRLGIVNPTFSEYERSARLSGVEVVSLQLEADQDFILDEKNIKEQLDQIDGLFICNPNNPTGNSHQLRAIAKVMQDLDKLLIVDETFMEFVTEKETYSLVPLIKTNDKVIVIKAITKYFGLPGIRLGYGVTSNVELLNKMYFLKEPWTINGFAEHLTGILLKDRVYQQEIKEYFKEERHRVLQALNTLRDVKVYPTSTNFILLELKGMTAAHLQEQMLLKYHILIRDASNFKGLDENFIRVAIKGKKDNEKLLQAMQFEIK